MVCVSAFAQRKGIYADPKIDNLRFYNMQDIPVSADLLETGNMAKIRLTISNTNKENAIPEGTCKLKINLGMLCFLTTDLQSAAVPLSEYFTWGVLNDPFNQTIIIGELKQDLPADFSGIAEFSFMPRKEGSSIITSQFFVTNHRNPKFLLSDKDPTNNIVSNYYTNLAPLSAKFINFKASAKACNVDMNWQVTGEDKLTNFIVETSTDGANYSAAKTIAVNGTKSYFNRLEDITTGNLYLRIKAEAETGQYIYSIPVLVSKICNGRFEVALYPNPVTRDIRELKIVTKEGLFNGKYKIRLLNIDGKELSSKDFKLSNQDQVKYDITALPGGSYHLVVTGEDGQTQSLRFVVQ